MNYKALVYGVVTALTFGANSFSATNGLYGAESRPVANETEDYPCFLPLLGQKPVNPGGGLNVKLTEHNDLFIELKYVFGDWNGYGLMAGIHFKSGSRCPGLPGSGRPGITFIRRRC